jgi:parallel beta-helix repeat protein
MKTINYLLVLAFIMPACALLNASTNVPAGNVSGTWTLANSPYIVNGNITIAGGTTLTIEPGVSVEFSGHYELKIFGRLLAVGTATDSIKFIAQTPATGWYGLRFDLATASDTSRVTYCRIQHGIANGSTNYNVGGGIWCSSSNKVVIKNSLIRYCKASINGGGIYLSGSSIRIIDCSIVSDTAVLGGGIYATTCSPLIYGCDISNNHDQGIYFTSGSPTIQNCSINGNDICGLEMQNGTTANQPVVTGCTFIGNNGYPLKTWAGQVWKISGNSYTYNTNQMIFVNGERISKDGNWVNPGVPYQVSGGIAVYGTDGGDGITVWTIDPGNVLMMGSDNSITIGFSSTPGGLIAVGTESDSIFFKADIEFPSPGYWGGLDFSIYASTANCQLSYCHLEYGGSSSKYTITINLCSPVFSHTVIQYSGNRAVSISGHSTSSFTDCSILSSGVSGDGWEAVYIYNSSPLFSYCTIRNNAQEGFLIFSNDATNMAPVIDHCNISYNGTEGVFVWNYNEAKLNVTLTHCTMNYNNGYPAWAFPDNLRNYHDNSYTGNTHQSIYVYGGTISHDATWVNNDVAFQVKGSLTIQGQDGADNVTTLTLAAGDSLVFDGSLFCYIGSNSNAALPGALKVEGTESDTVILISDDPSIPVHNWKGLYFYQYAASSQCVLDYCKISSAGNGLTYNVYCNISSPTFNHCRINNSAGSAVWLEGASSPAFDHCLISGCVRYGINCNSAFNYPTVTNTAIDYCGTGYYPVSGYADMFSGFSDNSYTGNVNPYIYVKGDTVEKDATWENAGISYRIFNDVYVMGTDGPDGVTTLTLEPGVILRFRYEADINGLWIGHASDPNFPGALWALGTPTQPVFFTTNGNVTPGAWKGICFNDYARDTLCLFDFCTIEYGGNTTNESIYCNASSPAILNTVVKNAHGSAIYCTNSSNPLIKNCLIRDTQYAPVTGISLNVSSPVIQNTTIVDHLIGLNCTGGSDPDITNCIFYNNTTAGISSAIAISDLNYSDFYSNGINYSGTAPTGFGTTSYTNSNGDPCDVYYNIFLNPSFFGAATDDFHLLGASDCRNAGDPATDSTDYEIDLDGNPRFMESNIDMGPYETGYCWRGATSSDWFNAANWSLGAVPGSADIVTIPQPAYYINAPVVSTSTSCQKLIIKKNGRVTFQNGATITLTGN